jgi:hypothetical protein
MQFSSIKSKSSIVVVATCTFLCYWTAFCYDGGVFMKEIKLTQGKVALVDDADYEWLNQWKWHANISRNTFYAKRAVWISGEKKYIHIKMHRLILGLTDPLVLADHKDGNGLNNQRENLRSCTEHENRKNRSSYIGSKSKYKGVSLSPPSPNWRATITINGRMKHLGYFAKEEDAALAYNEAAANHHGEFARLNILPRPYRLHRQPVTFRV